MAGLVNNTTQQAAGLNTNSALQYGPFRIDIIKTNYWKREAVYAGRDYLYHRHELSLLGLLSPASSAFFWPGQVGLAPGGGPANQVQAPIPRGAFNRQTINQRIGSLNPPIVSTITDQAIRHQFMAPRQQLDYQVGGIRLLYSPMPGYNTDANWGPKVLHFDILEWQGPRTAKVEVTFEAAVNECVYFNQTSPAILSQQWEEMVEIDEHFYTVRTINGRVVCRSDVLLDLSQVPDTFRNQLFHPVGPNMKRDHVYVRQREDGNTLDYVIVDRERAVNWSSPNVTRIEARQAFVQNASKMGEAGIVRIYAGGLSGAIASGREGSKAGPEGGILGAIIGGSLGSLAAGYTALPQVQHEIDVKVWGNRRAFRSDLYNVAAAIIQARTNLLGLATAGRILQIEQDLAGTAVHANVTFFTGPITGIVQSVLGGFVGQGSVVDLSKFFGTISDDTGTVLQAASSTKIPSLPNDKGSRGTTNEVLLAQVLQSQCSSPAAPPPFQSAATTYNPPAVPSPIP